MLQVLKYLIQPQAKSTLILGLVEFFYKVKPLQYRQFYKTTPQIALNLILFKIPGNSNQYFRYKTQIISHQQATLTKTVGMGRLQFMICKEFMKFASVSGGAVWISHQKLNAQFDKIEFKKHYSLQGGVFTISSITKINISNSNFSDQYAQDGMVIYSNADYSTIILQNNSFNGHLNLSSYPQIQPKFFRGYQSLYQSAFILRGLSQQSLCSENIYQNFQGGQKGGVFLLQGTSLSDYNSKYLNNSAILGGAIYSYQSNFVSQGNLFSLNYANEGGVFYFEGDSSIDSFKDVYIMNNASTSGVASLLSGSTAEFIQETKLYINSSIFNQGTALVGGALYSSSQAEVYISSSKFMNNWASQYGGSIYAAQSIVLNINDTIFQGAAMQISNSPQLVIYNNSFKNFNSQSTGGVLYLQSTITGIQESEYNISFNEFVNNQASEGGAIYFYDISEVSVFQNIFEGNKAIVNQDSEGNGGAINHYCSQANNCQNIRIQNNQFKQNLAENSGGAIKWNLIQPIIQNNIFSDNKGLQYANDYASFQQKVMEISQVSKHRLLANEAQGQFDKQIPSQRSGGPLPSIQIALLDHYDQIVSNLNGLSIQVKIDKTNLDQNLTYGVYLEGPTSFAINEGIVNVSDLILTGTPGQSYTIILYSESDKEEIPDLEFKIMIRLRLCEIGEQFTDSGKCIPCPSPGSYLLEVQSSPGMCKQCDSARQLCYGGAQTGPNKGYWRSSNISENFIECYNPNACLGKHYQEAAPVGECAYGYRGILCADCDANFGSSSNYKCAKCPNFTENYVKITFVFLLTALALIFQIRLLWPTFVNFLNFYIAQVQGFFDYTTPIMQTTDQIFSTDCLINTSVNTEDNKECDDIDGESRMHAFLEVKCYNGPHYFWTVFIALPSLFVWGAGIPFFAFVLLRNHRKSIESYETREKLGFLYKGYKSEFYYWEIIIIYRKALIAVVATTLNSLGSIFQALIALVIISLATIANARLKPFYQKQLNDLETVSLIASLLMLYCGLFFVQDKQSATATEYSDKRSIVQLSEETYIFFFFVILGSNACFFILWVFRLIQELRILILRKSQSLYFNLFVCRNQYRFNRDLKQLNQQRPQLYNILMKIRKLKQAINNQQIVLDEQTFQYFKSHISFQNLEKQSELKKQKSRRDKQQSFKIQRVQKQQLQDNQEEEINSEDFKFVDEKLEVANYEHRIANLNTFRDKMKSYSIKNHEYNEYEDGIRNFQKQIKEKTQLKFKEELSYKLNKEQPNSNLINAKFNNSKSKTPIKSKKLMKVIEDSSQKLNESSRPLKFIDQDSESNKSMIDEFISDYQIDRSIIVNQAKFKEIKSINNKRKNAASQQSTKKVKNDSIFVKDLQSNGQHIQEDIQDIKQNKTIQIKKKKLNIFKF
eukprot:403363820